MTDFANPPEAEFVRFFAPEVWSPARRLGVFAGAPFRDPVRLAQTARAADNRRSRFRALAEVLNFLRPSLEADVRETDKRGHSPARNSRRYAAIAESLFLELYSSIDATREAIYSAYHGISGVQKGSNLRLFKRAAEKSYGPEFPAEIRELLAGAFDSWFLELRKIRTEVSHGDIGACHLVEPDRVLYTHGGLGTSSRAFVVEDLEEKLAAAANNVFDLVDGIFRHLCRQLDPNARRVVCGIYRARLYERDVEFSEELDRESGVCYSRTWFEGDPEFRCPIRGECGAYSR